MKTVVLSLLLSFFILPCLAQNKWYNYNTSNIPLASDRISHIYIDHDDNLWAAYAGAGGEGFGLVMYDGTNWTQYTSANSGLPNNDVRVITSDNNGNLWFGCYNAGLVRFDGSTWTRYFTGNSNIQGDDVVDIDFDHDNKLWVSCSFSGLSSYDGTTWKKFNYMNAPFPENNCVGELIVARDNSIWVGLACAGGLAHFDPLSNTWKSFNITNSSIPDHTVRSLFEDSSGKIWMTFMNKPSQSFDGTTWTEYPGARRFISFAQDKNNQLWASENGLFKFENAKWTEVKVENLPDNASSVYNGLTFGKDGRIWWSVLFHGLWTNPEPALPKLKLTNDSFIPVFGGKIKWADLDNDADLDLIYCGTDNTSPLTMVYENVSGSYVAKQTSLPNISSGSFALADYDNDGDTDVIISGSGSQALTRLYRNDGNFQFVLAQSFPAMVNSTAAWGDVDNDNDPDLLLTGAHNGSPTTYLYENRSGNFVLLDNSNLPNRTESSLAFGDVNGDDKIDVLISGVDNTQAPHTSVYLNNGNKTFTVDTRSTLTPLYKGDVEWADFDNDGDIDAMASGYGLDDVSYTIIYENVAGKLIEREEIRITPASDNRRGGSSWADFNKDGRPDILITGRHKDENNSVTSVFRIFMNEGNGKFTTSADINLPGINESSVDVADFDGDGDSDIAFLGMTASGAVVTGIYESTIEITPPANTPPAFTVEELVEVDEDFQPFFINITPATVPANEAAQVVTYSMVAIGDANVKAVIDATTGKISVTAIPDRHGPTVLNITADDGQNDFNTFSTNIVINVSSVVDAPQVSEIRDLVFETGVTTPNVQFVVDDREVSIDRLQISATSSNADLIKDSNITISGTGTERLLTFVPETGVYGETTITIKVSNGSKASEQHFKVTILNVTSTEGPLTGTIHAYPNPVYSDLNISVPYFSTSPTTIIVTGVAGNEIARYDTSNRSFIIDMSMCKPGVYILRILNATGVSTQEMIVKM